MQLLPILAWMNPSMHARPGTLSRPWPECIREFTQGNRGSPMRGKATTHDLVAVSRGVVVFTLGKIFDTRLLSN